MALQVQLRRFPLIRSEISLHLLPVTCFYLPYCPLACPGTFGCGATGTSSSSFYSVAMVSVPNCVDSGTQTDITFQNMVAVGKSRGRHHHHHHQGRDPSPPPPSPPPPHLVAPKGLEEL